MGSFWKSHVVLSGSVEHALLKSAATDLPRTRRQLLAIAVQGGLKQHDDQTVTTALRRLSATGLLQSSRSGALYSYRLAPQGAEVLKVLIERLA